MSGHSKWHKVKNIKGVQDAKRGKIFTKHAKMIAIAAREGGDPSMNPSLRTAIDNAKADNVPNTNIEKAIKKGTGADKEAMNLEETLYEGFGPCGTAIFAQVITDNKNRAVSNIKTIFLKHGGRMGEVGSVGWMFQKKGLIFAKIGDKNPEEAELMAIDAGASDISLSNNELEVITDPSRLNKVRENLEKAGFEVEKAEFTYIANNPVKIANEEDARKILNLIEALEDDDDVANVYANFDIPEEFIL